jgi:hypothetical protein
MRIEEAKTRWCPFVRVRLKYGDREIEGNRVETSGSVNVNCIADGCMAWRAIAADHGYCGLAGGE